MPRHAFLRLPILPLLSCLLLPCVLLAGACGGGGGLAGATPEAKPSLEGAVETVDGLPDAVGGLTFTLQGTGEQATTAGDGSFVFQDVPTGSILLALGAPALALHRDGPPVEGPDDDDGSEAHDREIEIRDIRAGERIRLRLRIRDGRLERVDVSRSEHDEREVEVDLRLAPDTDTPGLEGELELEQRVDRQRFEVEVEYASPGRNLELVVIDDLGIEESQGLRVVDALGEAEWELRDGSLPFAAADLAELVGHQVVVRDATTGRDLLIGFVPELPPSAPAPRDDDRDDHDDDGHHDDDHRHGDDDHGDDDHGDDRHGEDDHEDDHRHGDDDRR